MTAMDKRRSILNVSVSIISRVILLIAAIFVRRLLIQNIGNNVNGLNSLYISIIGMLTVAELGVGRAIVYSMYSPIVAGEKRKIAALYCLYRKLYRIIGAVVFVGGLAVMPFLPRLISDYDQVSVNVYSTFLLTLVSVVISYLFAAKTSLIEAHKDNYITTGIATISTLVRYGLQIATILLWKSFSVFLICQIISTLLVWVMTEGVVRRKYPDIITQPETVDASTRSEIIKNTKAMLMHKIGVKLVNTIDSMVISGFIGIVVLGKYSNYTYICSAMVGIINLFFTPLTSVIGHLCAEGNKEKTREYFNYFYCLNYILGVVFFLGYYAVIDAVVRLLFGSGLSVSNAIAFIITLNQFIQYMRNAALLFRNASGTFYHDRWKPIAEGVVNLVLSLLFVMVFPEDYRVVGVIVATIITNLLICDIVEPFVIFKHVFGQKPGKFYIKNYAYIGLFVVALFVMTFLTTEQTNAISSILVNGCISVVVSFGLLAIVAVVDRDFRNEVLTMGRKAAACVGRKRTES
jgi:O-antigen/teichoic acid export membrane protein